MFGDDLELILIKFIKPLLFNSLPRTGFSIFLEATWLEFMCYYALYFLALAYTNIFDGLILYIFIIALRILSVLLPNVYLFYLTPMSHFSIRETIFAAFLVLFDYTFV